jgi:hypothetical protein
VPLLLLELEDAVLEELELELDAEVEATVLLELDEDEPPPVPAGAPTRSWTRSSQPLTPLTTAAASTASPTRSQAACRTSPRLRRVPVRGKRASQNLRARPTRDGPTRSSVWRAAVGF